MISCHLPHGIGLQDRKSNKKNQSGFHRSMSMLQQRHWILEEFARRISVTQPFLSGISYMKCECICPDKNHTHLGSRQSEGSHFNAFSLSQAGEVRCLSYHIDDGKLASFNI